MGICAASQDLGVSLHFMVLHACELPFCGGLKLFSSFLKAFLLEYSWFTMLCSFPLYSKVNQLHRHLNPHF